MNELICEKLNQNVPFSVIRYDNTLSYWIHSYSKQQQIDRQFFNPITFIEGGINPNNEQYVWDTVIPRNIHEGLNCDFLAFCDISTYIRNDPNFLSKFPNQHITIIDHTYGVLDPGLMVGGILEPEIEVPWTSLLKGKKVLALSTHRDSILSQWNNIDNIWGDKRDKIVPFELVGCVRSPYHPIVDDRQYEGCTTWEETVESVKKEIDKYDYDVLFIGSTNSAVFANYAKSKGKIGIQIGGIMQLYFGILGNRWTKHEGNAKWAAMANEHWIYPLESDYAKNRDSFSYLETNYAYWGKC